ncbi:MAG: ROK family protein [Firmicutes bacterium]|nr:ROK family protein [Bacillota bacterium]
MADRFETGDKTGGRYTIGVDLGGTKVATALTDIHGRILQRAEVPTGAQEGAGAVISRIVDSIRAVMNTVVDGRKVSSEEVLGIGIGSPGPLDVKKGIVLYSPNLKWENIPICDPIAAAFGLPTYLDNDASVAAMAESRFGAGKGVPNMIYMTVSTGIGGGMIINGRLYRGSHGNAGEIGHMTIKPDGPRCGCGNFGCLEALASGTAIAREAAEGIRAGVATTLREKTNGDPARVTARLVGEALREGDSFAREVIHQAGNYLGIGLANLVNIFDPEMIVIGGGVSRIGEELFEPARKTMRERALAAVVKDVKIVPALLGGDSGVLGAAGLVLDQISHK